MSSKGIFMDIQNKFAQGIHRLVGIFDEKMAIILRKSDIQNLEHRLDFPMLSRKIHQMFDRDIPAGNVIICFLVMMLTSLYNPLHREDRPQSRPFLLFRSRNILDFSANLFLHLSGVLLHRLVALILKNRRTSSNREG